MKKLLVAGPIFSISGYGNYCRTVVKVLSQISDIDIRLDVKYWGGDTAFMHYNENLFFSKLASQQPFKEEEIAEVNYLMIHLPDGYPINDPNFMKYKSRINLTMFETDNILDLWAKCINNYADSIIVPTDFNKESFAKKVNKPIHTFTFIQDEYVELSKDKLKDLPISVINNTNLNKYGKARKDSIKFYHNCNYGCRKSPVETVRAYLNAFKPLIPKMYEFESNCIIKNTEKTQAILEKNNLPFLEDNLPLFKDKELPSTQLFLKWYISHEQLQHEVDYFSNIISELRKETGNYDSEIYLIHENLLPHQMEGLYESIDIYVSPSRGEGLNLPACEAILHNKPVILSKWSAHRALIPEWLDNTNDLQLIRPYWVDGSVKIIENIKDPFYAPKAHEEGHKWLFVNEDLLQLQYLRAYHDVIYNIEKVNNTNKVLQDHIKAISDPQMLREKFETLFLGD